MDTEIEPPAPESSVLRSMRLRSNSVISVQLETRSGTTAQAMSRMRSIYYVEESAGDEVRDSSVEQLRTGEPHVTLQ